MPHENLGYAYLLSTKCYFTYKKIVPSQNIRFLFHLTICLYFVTKKKNIKTNATFTKFNTKHIFKFFVGRSFQFYFLTFTKFNSKYISTLFSRIMKNYHLLKSPKLVHCFLTVIICQNQHLSYLCCYLRLLSIFIKERNNFYGPCKIFFGTILFSHMLCVEFSLLKRKVLQQH